MSKGPSAQRLSCQPSLFSRIRDLTITYIFPFKISKRLYARCRNAVSVLSSCLKQESEFTRIWKKQMNISTAHAGRSEVQGCLAGYTLLHALPATSNRICWAEVLWINYQSLLFISIYKIVT